MSNDQSVSVSRVISAPPSEIFDILADPAGHAKIDGSGTVQGAKTSERLRMGSKFGMSMKIGVPYSIGNTVVEFEEDALIAWEHFGGHRWRYELTKVEGGTEVTETFDWSTARIPKVIELLGYPKKHPASMEKTLARLEAVVSS